MIDIVNLYNLNVVALKINSKNFRIVNPVENIQKSRNVMSSSLYSLTFSIDFYPRVSNHANMVVSCI